jgi:hypothetical protein
MAALFIAIVAWFCFCIMLPVAVFVSDACDVLGAPDKLNNPMTAFVPCGASPDAQGMRDMLGGTEKQLDVGYSSLCAAYWDLCSLKDFSSAQPDCCTSATGTCTYKEVCPLTRDRFANTTACCNTASPDSQLPADAISTCCPVLKSAVSGGFCPTDTSVHAAMRSLCGSFATDADVAALLENSNFTSWKAGEAEEYFAKTTQVTEVKWGCPKFTYISRAEYAGGQLAGASIDAAQCKAVQYVTSGEGAATPFYTFLDLNSIPGSATPVKAVVNGSDIVHQGCTAKQYYLCDDLGGAAHDDSAGTCTNQYPAAGQPGLTGMMPCAKKTFKASSEGGQPGSTINTLIDLRRSVGCTAVQVQEGSCTAGTAGDQLYSSLGTQAYLAVFAHDLLNTSLSFFDGYHNGGSDTAADSRVSCDEYNFGNNNRMCVGGVALKNMMECNFVPGVVHEMWVPLCSDFKYGVHLMTFAFCVLGLIMMLSAHCLIRGFKQWDYKYQRQYLEEREEVVDRSEYEA